MVVDSSGKLMPTGRPRRFFDWDYFCSGGTTSGTIGRMGWNLLGSGTPAFSRLDSNLATAVRARLSTSNANGNRSNLLFGLTESAIVMNPTESAIMQGVWRMNGSLATKRVFFGWNSNFALDPITGNVNALGLAYDSSVSPNYLVVSRIGLTLGAATDTGIPVPANSGQLISIVQSEATSERFEFHIGTDAGGIITQSSLLAAVTIPQTGGFSANFGFGLTTLAAAVSALELGYWGMTSSILPRLFSSDSNVEEMVGA